MLKIGYRKCRGRALFVLLNTAGGLYPAIEPLMDLTIMEQISITLVIANLDSLKIGRKHLPQKQLRAIQNVWASKDEGCRKNPIDTLFSFVRGLCYEKDNQRKDTIKKYDEIMIQLIGQKQELGIKFTVQDRYWQISFKIQKRDSVL